MYAARKAMMFPGGIPDIAKTDNPNLLAMYTMDNISGATLIDESPNNENGTIIGATAVSGHLGNALSFDGNDVVDTVILTPTSCSISFWFSTALPGASELFWAQASLGSTRGVFSGAGGIAFFSRDSSNTYKQTIIKTGFQDSVYHHCVVVQDNAVLRIYLDSDLKDTLNMTTALTSWIADSWIGGDNKVTLVSPYTGQVDQFRAFNRAIIQSEITELFNGGVGV
jgi:hypothetical protein